MAAVARHSPAKSKPLNSMCFMVISTEVQEVTYFSFIFNIVCLSFLVRHYDIFKRRRLMTAVTVDTEFTPVVVIGSMTVNAGF
jgi:hypothetical protein